ncbi:MAG: AMP-binding protein [Candidatus Ratteibacteria bacterium]|nr:AMP-binding protein [Candidatus Ratteibacteria bacterium]
MNVGKILNEITEKKKDQDCLIFEDKIFRYQDVLEKTNKYANFFKSIGVEKGKKVAIFLYNCPEYVFSYLAIFKIGATGVPIDHRLKVNEICNILNHSQSEYLITYNFKDFNADEIKKSAPSIKEIILIDEKTSHTLSIGESENFSSFFPTTDIDDNLISLIIYTSGTTGIPKGVIWTYKMLESPIESIRYFNLFKGGETTLCCIPFSHNGGIIYPILMVLGAKLVLMKMYQPLLLLKNLLNWKVDFTFIVPTMLIGVLNLKEIDEFLLPDLKWAAVFGAPSSPDILEKFRKVAPHAKLFSGYGLTESSAPNFLHPLDRIKLDSVGMPVPWIEVKIIDEQGIEVKRGEIGEIIMKGWPITPGYYNQPDITREVIKDGWLYTGDIGKFDEDSYLYIVGRKKEMIKVGGLYVFTPEIEEVIYKHPKVREVAVIGVPDKLRGESVKAIIVPKEKDLTEKEIKKFCRQYLASYKIPTIIEFRNELPKTGTGKIKKELLR